jgi:hypothetical protein
MFIAAIYLALFLAILAGAWALISVIDEISSYPPLDDE